MNESYITRKRLDESRHTHEWVKWNVWLRLYVESTIRHTHEWVKSCHTHEWVMSCHTHEWVESCHTYEWVESCHSHEWVVSCHTHEWVKSCHTHAWVKWNIWVSQATRINKSHHLYEWGISHSHTCTRDTVSLSLVSSLFPSLSCFLFFWLSSSNPSFPLLPSLGLLLSRPSSPLLPRPFFPIRVHMRTRTIIYRWSAFWRQHDLNALPVQLATIFLSAKDLPQKMQTFSPINMTWLHFQVSFMCMTWLTHVFEMSHLYVWHDSFICVTWLTQICDMTHSNVWDISSIRVTWLIRMCDMTHSYVWHDSIICVTWLIHMCDTTHSYMWHDSLTWLTHMCDMTQ